MPDHQYVEIFADTLPRQKDRLSSRWRNVYDVILEPGVKLVLGKPDFTDGKVVASSGTYRGEATWPSHQIAEMRAQEYFNPRKWEFRNGPPVDLTNILIWVDAEPE